MGAGGRATGAKEEPSGGASPMHFCTVFFIGRAPSVGGMPLQTTEIINSLEETDHVFSIARLYFFGSPQFDFLQEERPGWQHEDTNSANGTMFFPTEADSSAAK